jgi:hypothetical protein
MITVHCFGFSIPMPAFMFPFVIGMFLPILPILALWGQLGVVE